MRTGSRTATASRPSASRAGPCRARSLSCLFRSMPPGDTGRPRIVSPALALCPRCYAMYRRSPFDREEPGECQGTRRTSPVTVGARWTPSSTGGGPRGQSLSGVVPEKRERLQPGEQLQVSVDVPRIPQDQDSHGVLDRGQGLLVQSFAARRPDVLPSGVGRSGQRRDLRDDLHGCVEGTQNPLHVHETRPIRIGYARCSTVGQELQSQLDALARAQCTRVFSEKISSRIKERPELEKALTLAREIKAAAPNQPVILTVVEMKRLARSAAELMTLSSTLQKDGIQLELLSGPLTGVYDPNGAGALVPASRRERLRQAHRPLSGVRHVVDVPDGAMTYTTIPAGLTGHTTTPGHHAWGSRRSPLLTPHCQAPPPPPRHGRTR
ncbi:recombinase family protein [Streptomyces uncialis]|uniref:recombinase family protein n=1 Tax=Streptomyces uncialis TaxID=1048205 RepID=UPI00381D8B9D